MREFSPRRVRNIFICIDVAFCASSKITAELESVLPRMNARGAITALVSGGFTFFTERVAEEAGFLHHQANVLLQDSGLLTGNVASPVLGRAAKRSALGKYVDMGESSAADVLAVGDGANDSDMVTVAGLGVAYHAKPALKRVADAVIDHSDLTALLALQGIDPVDWA